MASKVIKNIEGKLAGKSFQSLLQMRGKFGSVPSARLYKKEVLRAVADSDPNMHKVIYGGSFTTHDAGKSFTKAIQHIHGGEGKVEFTEKARRMLNLKKGEEVKGEKADLVAKKLVTYFRKEASDAAPKTDEKNPLQLQKEARLREANLRIGRSQRLRAEDAGKKASGFANPTIQTGYAGGSLDQAGTSAITRGKNVQTSVSGDPTKNVAGQSAAQRAAGATGVAIPGQHASAPAATSSPVHLAGGIGLSRIEGKPADRADDVAIPRIGIAKEDGGTEKTIPTPGLTAEDLDDKPQKDTTENTPQPANINEGLPLGE
jgi:hypothetical protein